MPIKLNGSSSGYTQIEAAATAGDNTLTLPTASGTLMTTGGTNTFTANQVIEVTDNTNAALRITQLGTGAAIRVEDETNPDSTPFVVDASGNVGVGTTPGFKLDVLGSGIVGRIGSTTGSVYLGFSNSANSQGYIGYEGTGGTNMTFYTANAERMRINSSGNVFFGGITSIISGSEAGVVQSQSSGKAASFSTTYPSNGGNSAVTMGRTASNGAVAEFFRGTSQVGAINVDTTSTAYATSSDYRLKEDYQPINDPIGRVNALKPVNFAWKVNGSRVDGFIAHEAAEVVPEAVTGEKDAVDAEGKPVYQGIDQSKLVPLLTAALQEALTKIDALEARIAALENA